MAEKKTEKKSSTEETEQEPVVVEESEDIPGGLQTTDPAFKDGAMELESYSNMPRKEEK